ncbi:MAG: DUF6600 domain-containing protein [Chthoniobacteraceae bacterium]
MKTKLLLLALAFSTLAPLSARAEVEVSFDYFYDNLSPYGDWLEVGEYGNCWRPRDVEEDWSPYTDGYWSYTDAGWTWISYEDFGDIVYHYGRWVRVNDVGWCWVPDTDWGPAWVSWRKTDDHIGWAPLPPEARWRASVGISVWSDERYDIGPSYYNFCPIVDFGAVLIRPVCVPRARVISLFGGSVNITNISYNSYGRHVFCGGPDYGYINRYSHRQVPALKLVQNTTIINNNVTIINNQRVVRPQRNAVAGNTLQVFAPTVINKGGAKAIRPPAAKVIGKPQFDKGWAGVKDPVELRKMREKVKTDTKGLTPETAPARAVQVTDLKPLPEKADAKAQSPVKVAPRPGKAGKEKPVAVLPPETQPGATPGGTSDKGRPVKPSVLPAERPGKVAVDQPDKPAKSVTLPPADRPEKTVTKAGKPARPEIAPMPARPTTTGTPLKKPFRQNVTPVTPEAPARIQPVAPVKTDRKSPDRDAIARQRLDAESGQRRMAEQADRQRQAAIESQQRAAKAQSQQRPPQVQPKPEYQRPPQVQPKPQMQRPPQAQPKQQYQPRPQIQPKPQPQPKPQYQPRPQSQPKPQIQPRPQPQPQMPPTRVSPGAGQLTPEQIEAMKKKRGK